MVAEPTPQSVEDAFDESCDNATHAVIDEFEWMGLPDKGTDQRTALLHQINDAITAIMQEWK